VKAVIIGIVIILSGCGTKVSLGLTGIMHSTEIDEPLGVVRIRKDFTEKISGECEHISSAFVAHDVATLDHCGFFYNF